MRCPLLVTIGVTVLLALGGCGGDEDEGTSAGGNPDLPAVYTTFYPTTYFVRRLGAEDVRLVCPLPRGADPIFWEPDAGTIQAYQRADLIVVNGAGLERWVARASLPEDRVVDTARPFEDEWLTFENAVEHSHGPAGRHAHEGVDGHTWLDPQLAKVQAEEIAVALQRVLPEKVEAIDERLDRLLADLDALDDAYVRLTDSYDGEAILTSHPAYNYLARRYDWNLVGLDLDPETVPDDAALAHIREVLEEQPARYILWESAPLDAVAKRLKDALGLESVVFSPCETTPPGGRDYLAEMQANLFRLGPVLTPAEDDE